MAVIRISCRAPESTGPGPCPAAAAAAPGPTLGTKSGSAGIRRADLCPQMEPCPCWTVLGSGRGLCWEPSPCLLLQEGQRCPVERGSRQGQGTQGLGDLASDGGQTLGSQWRLHVQGGLCCCSGPRVGAQGVTGLLHWKSRLVSGWRRDTDSGPPSAPSKGGTAWLPLRPR